MEGNFFNDLVAFDLNTLQSAGNKWEMLIPNGGFPGQPVPPPRTNHSVVSWQDKLFLFGGTDGSRWFNDVWTYDPSRNLWSELDCIGYIPAPREGHAAALINDTMYIFGGRIQDGSDLGDLVAFKISARRWYMFQNMGLSPSPRSGHSMTAFGNHIIVLAGEPSSAPRDSSELSLAYILDTTKIRYPDTPVTQGTTPQQQQLVPSAFNYDRTAMVPKQAGIPGISGAPRSESPMVNGVGQAGRRIPGSGPPPQALAPTKQAAQARINEADRVRAKTPSRGAGTPQFERDTMTPTGRDVNREVAESRPINQYQPQQAAPASKPGSIAPSRSGSRLARQQPSIDSEKDTPRASVDAPAANHTRDVPEGPADRPADSGVGTPSAPSPQHEGLVKELEAARNRNAWYASELALARKAGYQPNSSGNPILDQQAADVFGDDDKPLIEALLRMKSELASVQESINSQSVATASRIAEIEKQRDAAISEAAYAKAKFAAHGGNGSQVGSPQPDAVRGSARPEIARVNDMSKRLAGALNAQKELSAKLESVTAELDSERRARSLAEETAEAHEKRVTDLDGYKQRTAVETEGLRAQLYEAQRAAREEAANCAEAVAAHKLLMADKNDMDGRHERLIEESHGHTSVLELLKQAVAASSEKADHLELKLEEERALRSDAESRLARLKAELEQQTNELEAVNRRLRDTEDMAEKHAQEAKTHRDAVLSGLGAVTNRAISDSSSSSDSRVEMLSQQLDAASNLSRQYKESADGAAERLRSAEERIAGLETYQEQTSRENLAVRKQAQVAMREVQTLHADKATLQTRMDRAMLDSNALEVQLKTLKNLLDERGVSAADVRRSRVMESPAGASRYGTPDLNRLRELERQLDESGKAHDELRSAYETREQETAREWEEKLQLLTNDHHESIKYVRALEKYLTKMKAEVQKSKSTAAELETQLATRGADGGADPDATAAAEHAAAQAAAAARAEWEDEREELRRAAAEAQRHAEGATAALEAQVTSLAQALSAAERERERERERARADAAAEAAAELAAERERGRRERAAMEARAVDAERKVQMFLDQFESSVDNYRRLSRLEQAGGPAGGVLGARGLGGAGAAGQRGDVDADSLYSSTTVDDEDELDLDDVEAHHHAGMMLGRAGPDHGAGEAGLHGAGGTGASSTTAAAGTTVTGEKPQRSLSARKRDRTSTALDTLTSELETLKNRWESTSRNYKLSDRFEFERSPTRGGLGGLGVGSGPAPSVSAPAPAGGAVAAAHANSSASNLHAASLLGAGVGGAAGMVKGLDGAKEKENVVEPKRESLSTWARNLELGGPVAEKSS